MKCSQQLSCYHYSGYHHYCPFFLFSSPTCKRQYDQALYLQLEGLFYLQQAASLISCANYLTEQREIEQFNEFRVPTFIPCVAPSALVSTPGFLNLLSFFVLLSNPYNLED